MRSLDLVNTAAAIIRSHIQTIDKEKSFVKSSNPIEHLHQMRVAARRLRSSLSIFKDLFEKKQLEAWREGIRMLGQSLGKARELDIQIRFLESMTSKPRDNNSRTGINPNFVPPLAGQNSPVGPSSKISKRFCVLGGVLPEFFPAFGGAKSGIKKLIVIFKEDRRMCQETVIRALNHSDKTNTLKDLQNSLASLSPLVKNFQAVFLKRVKKVITRRFEELKNYERHIHTPSNAHELHLLRIAAKKLRYSLEVLDFFYRGKFKRPVQQAKSIQDILGDIHEYDVWIETIPNIAKQQAADSDMGSACQFLIDHCKKSRLTRYREFITLWKKLKEGDFFSLNSTLSQADTA